MITPSTAPAMYGACFSKPNWWRITKTNTGSNAMPSSMLLLYTPTHFTPFTKVVSLGLEDKPLITKKRNRDVNHRRWNYGKNVTLSSQRRKQHGKQRKCSVAEQCVPGPCHKVARQLAGRHMFRQHFELGLQCHQARPAFFSSIEASGSPGPNSKLIRSCSIANGLFCTMV